MELLTYCLLLDSLVQFGGMEIAFISYVNMNTSKFSTSPTLNTYLAMLKNCAEYQVSVIYSANQQGDRHVALYIFEMVPCVIPRIRLGALVFLSFFTHLVKHRSYLHMTNHRTGEIQHSDLSRYLELISPFR